MRRTLIGAGMGAVCGVLALAAAGAWGGYTRGAEWAAAPAPPPAAAAVTWALRFTASYGWLAGAVGGAIGGLAGPGSWAVRPNSSVKTSVADH